MFTLSQLEAWSGLWQPRHRLITEQTLYIVAISVQSRHTKSCSDAAIGNGANMGWGAIGLHGSV